LWENLWDFSQQLLVLEVKRRFSKFVPIPPKNYIQASKAEQHLPLRFSLNTTRLQPEGSLSANWKKFPLHKSLNAK
jgi:hypothetical protein